MVLNARGKMVENWWQKISVQFPLVQLDRYQIMPNHVHGIIIINEIFIDPVGVDPRVDPCIDIGRTHRSAPTTFGRTHRSAPTTFGRTHRSAPTLGTIIQWFKTMTTNEYIRHVKHDSWEPFNQRVWQRNYYEHIIRSQKNLGAIREYIMNNPRGWDKDQDNPENFSRRSSQRT